MKTNRRLTLAGIFLDGVNNTVLTEIVFAERTHGSTARE